MMDRVFAISLALIALVGLGLAVRHASIEEDLTKECNQRGGFRTQGICWKGERL